MTPLPTDHTSTKDFCLLWTLKRLTLSSHQEIHLFPFYYLLKPAKLSNLFRYPFRLILLRKVWTPLSLQLWITYSIIIVLKEGQLWHLKTHESLYTIKQRNQKHLHRRIHTYVMSRYIHINMLASTGICIIAPKYMHLGTDVFIVSHWPNFWKSI